jgi:hypothetical protein
VLQRVQAGESDNDLEALKLQAHRGAVVRCEIDAAIVARSRIALYALAIPPAQ